jgi:ABC-type dipeptide/oligopeptide/nickel transport system permease component
MDLIVIMGTYIFRRIILTIPVLVGILFLTFALTRLLPSDPCHQQLQEHATEEICREFNKRYGLDKSIPQQFVTYMGDVSKGDFGDSFETGYAVSRLMVERFPQTLELTVYAMLFAVSVGIPLGVLSAYYHNSPIDVGTMITANMGVSMPVFWLGLMLAYIFGVLLKGTPFWLPPGGSGIETQPFYEAWGLNVTASNTSIWAFIAHMDTLNPILTGNFSGFWDNFRHMILPMIALGTIPLSIIARMTRSSLLEVLGQNYVRTARAKGVAERNVVFKHAFRNALLPVVTIIGLSFGSLLSGAILTETIFGLSGVGDALFSAITGRDYTVVQAFTIVIAIIFVFVNLVVDIFYVFLDPRIKLE